MNEVRAIVEAFDHAQDNHERCAIATIVDVEGSSYRRPGARMLIRESGTTTGTISAGCLENDVIVHAKLVMRAGESKLVVYDNASTTDEMAWGLGLGCNGVVRVLIEPLACDSLYLDVLRRSYEAPPQAHPISVATIYEVRGSVPGGVSIGSRLLIGEVSGAGAGSQSLGDDAAGLIEREVREQMRVGSTSGVVSIEIEGATADVFFETLLPPVPLIVFGAGHDALPIVELSRGMGWQVEVVDPQAREASLARFDIADRVILARPEEIDGRVTVTPRTMALLMSHNYAHDVALLRFLLDSPARYIGVMGPRKRTERMLDELGETDELRSLREASSSRIHSPVGLDIGASGPAEIALSIVAEMRAILNGRNGGLLRERLTPIYGAGQEVATGGNSVTGKAPRHVRVPVGDGNTKRVGAIILAAGSSSRMGRPKQTLKFDGMTLIRRSVLAALNAHCSPVIVVTGAHAELSRNELEGLDVIEVLNPHWETGMASSIGAGLDGLLTAEPEAAAAVFMLCDQPFVNADVISHLISANRVTDSSIVASTYGETFGVPALFRRSMFSELAELEGAAGAKEVIKRHASEAHFLGFPEGDVDVDTPEDLARLISSDFEKERGDAMDRVLASEYDDHAESAESGENWPA